MKEKQLLNYFILTIFLGFALSFKLLGINCRPNFIFVAIMSPYVIYNRHYFTNHIIPYKNSLILFVLIYFLSTLINSGSAFFKNGVIAGLLLVVLYLHYVITNLLLKNSIISSFEKIVDNLITLGTFYGVVVTSGVFLSLLGITDRLVATNWLVAIKGFTPTKGPISGYGPIAAAYLSVIATLTFGKILEEKGRKVLIGVIKFSIMVFAIINSYSRTSWLALIIGIILLYFFRLSSSNKKNIRNIIYVIFTLITILFLLNKYFNTYFLIFLAKLNLLFDSDTGTGFTRILLWKDMLTDIGNNPILGLGGSAFLKYITFTGEPSENFFIEILHSEGILGALFLFIPIFLIIIRSIKNIKQARNQKYRNLLVLLFSAFISLLISAQVTPAAWGGFFWFFMGLLVSVNTIGNNVNLEKCIIIKK